MSHDWYGLENRQILLQTPAMNVEDGRCFDFFELPHAFGRNVFIALVEWWTLQVTARVYLDSIGLVQKDAELGVALRNVAEKHDEKM